MRLTGFITAASVCLALQCARAADRQVPLSPPTTRIGYTVFAIGLLPVSAMFDRFQGVVTEDPAAPDACRIQVTVDVASMRMDDADRRGQALGPEMFDAARYPTMHFSGSCAPQSVTGTLTLHGVSRAVTFAMRRDGSQVICDGTVLRRDFGIVGMRDMVGPRVHIRLSVRLPPELGAGSEGSATPHG